MGRDTDRWAEKLTDLKQWVPNYLIWGIKSIHTAKHNQQLFPSTQLMLNSYAASSVP